MPVPNVGGPYTVDEGDSVTLNASGTTDAEPGAVLSYAWSIDGDSQFVSASGISPTLTWSQLNHLGIVNGPGTYSVQVRVSDNFGNIVLSPSTTLTVAPTAHDFSLVPETSDPLKVDLVWGGSTGDDQVTFEQLDATTIRIHETERDGVTGRCHG